MKNKTNQYLATLPFFVGFYGSSLEGAIDIAEEQVAEDYAEKEKSEDYHPETYQPEHLRISKGEYASILIDCTDYRETYLKVSQMWVEAFDWWCRDNLGTPEKSFTWESMTSPREYNFTTDRVFAYVPTEVVEQLFRRSEEEGHKTLEKAIEDSFTSYDGFSSFYSAHLDDWLEKPMKEWDHNEVGTLVASAIEASEEFEDRSHFQEELYGMVFGNGEEDNARVVDWSKFEAQVETLRIEKQKQERKTT